MKLNISYHLKGHPIQNFGDFLSEYFLQTLFLPVGLPGRAIHLVGSVIADTFLPPPNAQTECPPDRRTIFWGCGARGQATLSDANRKVIEVLSVRGPLSRSALRLDDAIPIGDPGLLLPALYPAATRSDGLGKALLVPHFADKRTDAELLTMTGCEAILRPNIPNDPAAILQFIDEILAADFVLSAALHAAVVAAAYGRPFAFWDSGNINVPFKWADFAASVGIPSAFQIRVDDARRHYVEQVRPALRIPVLWPMLTVAPLAVRQDALIKIINMDVRRHGLSALSISPSSRVIDRLNRTLAGVPEP
jgi:Polysaccharide pyruvyl transferase